jgi:hypothetical protein
MVKNRINAWINSARINSWVSGGGGGGFGYLGSYAQTLSMLNGFGSAFGNFGWSRTATGWTTSDPVAIYAFMNYASRNNPSIGEMNMFINNYMHGNGGGGKLFRGVHNLFSSIFGGRIYLQEITVTGNWKIGWTPNESDMQRMSSLTQYYSNRWQQGGFNLNWLEKLDITFNRGIPQIETNFINYDWGAVTPGPFIFYAKGNVRDPYYNKHEPGHVIQYLILGPLNYYTFVAIPSLFAAKFFPEQHNNMPWEMTANQLWYWLTWENDADNPLYFKKKK